MNTRTNTDKTEVDKAYREALETKTPKRQKPPTPQFTSTPHVQSQITPSAPLLPEPNTSAFKKLSSDSPISQNPDSVNQPLKPILEKPLGRTLDKTCFTDATQFFSCIDKTRHTIRFALDLSEQEARDKAPTGIKSKDDNTMNDESIPSNTYATLRYAVEAVPFFDGQNIPLEYFVEECELAKTMLSPDSEICLTKVIHTRLTGEARRSVQEHDFTRINQLTTFLKNIFGSSKSLYELQAELGRVYQEKDEKVLPYANRVKAIGKRILEAHRTTNNGAIDPTYQTALYKEMCQSFIRGLTPEIEQRIARNLDVDATVTEALRIEKELRSINEIRSAQTTPIVANLQICQTCKKAGHATENCKLLNSNLGNEILICQICNKRGHSADKCRHRNSGTHAPVNLVQGNLITCQICSKSGHIAQNCRSNIICYTCQKPGHRSKECRSNPTTFNNNCQLCNKTGHNAKNCYSNPNRNNISNNENCQWCGRRGHTASQCRQRQNTNQTLSGAILCQLCNKAGHKALECRGNNSQDNRATQNISNQCRYCKAIGHLIENCTLRLENNRRRQGNSSGSPTTGANRGTDGTRRPVMTAQTEHEIAELQE